jgi:hypothetical protein
MIGGPGSHLDDTTAGTRAKNRELLDEAAISGQQSAFSRAGISHPSSFLNPAALDFASQHPAVALEE